MSFITATGVAIQSVEEILDELAAEQQGQIDPLVGTDPTNVLGQLNGIFASHEREDQEAIQELASALNPDSAEGAILDGICAITGTIRNGATPSRFSGSKKLSVSLDPGVVVLAGVTSFAVTADVTIVFVATETIENTSVVTASFLVSAESTVEGPIPALSGSVTTILTPTTGLNGVNNPFDAVLGKDIESDTELRLRREREIRQAGSSSADAILSDLLGLEDDAGDNPIISAVVLENVTDAIDSNFLPAHSFEAVIWDGIGAVAVNDDVAEIIHASRSAGIVSWGATTGTASDGSAERFSRATQRPVTIVSLILRYRPGYVGDAAVKAAITTAGNIYQTPVSAFAVDGEVPFSYYISIVMQLAGVSRIESIQWHLSGDTTKANVDLEPNVREIATFDSANITINSSAEGT